MIRRLPLWPTVIVGLAVATMIALGCWQLFDRRPKKLALLRELSANPSKPPMAFPRFPDDDVLFRRAKGFCLEPVSIRLEGAGAAGFRAVAQCRTGVEGPGMAVQLGTTRQPDAKVRWGGGPVSGLIAYAPDTQSLIGRAIRPAPRELMLIADQPAAGLAPNQPPDLAAIPNNHLSYAVQWFLFAAVATIIYLLALRRRQGARE